MIVGSVTKNPIQKMNFSFNGIHRTKGNYTAKQISIMNDISNNLQKTKSFNNQNRTYESILHANGFDVHMSDSIIKQNGIDLFLVNSDDDKIIPVGSYDNIEDVFNINDIEKSIKEDKKLNKVSLGLLLATTIALLAIAGAKVAKFAKTAHQGEEKILIQDSIKTINKNIKSIF